MKYISLHTILIVLLFSVHVYAGDDDVIIIDPPSIRDDPIFDDFVDCQNDFFEQDELKKGQDLKSSKDKHTSGEKQSDLRKNVKTKAKDDKELKGANQTARRGWGQNSCLPASLASLLEYWNRTTFSGILDGRDIEDTVDKVRNVSGTDATGTRLWNFTIGVTKYLQGVELAENFTFKVFVGGSGENDTTVLGNRSIRGVQVTYIADNNINFTEIIEEAKTETVIFIVNYPGVGAHAVALSDYNTNPNPGGTHTISVMDPRLGRVINVVVDDSFGTVFQFPNNVNAGLVHMISLSPKK